MSEKNRILIVDDELGPRESLRMILRDSYDVHTAINGREAIKKISETDYDLAILDIRMPDINGIELLKNIKERASTTEVIMITAYASVDTATRALRLGAVDYLIKPFELTVVRQTVQKAIEKRKESRSIKQKISDLQLANETLEQKIESTYTSIQSHYQETIDSLVAAVDAKDSYTKGHQERVAALVRSIGLTMGLPESDLRIVEQAATLHDIGKIGVTEAILRKPGELTGQEYEMVKKHSLIGAEILSPVKFLNEVVPLVKYHHEHIDGSGYPEGLKGDSIPLGARIIALADSIDAMLSERPYAKAKSFDTINFELKRVSGTQLDSDLVDILIKNGLLNEYILKKS